MDEPIVSQQELDSLLSLIQAVVGKVDADEGVTETLYDFRQGVKLTPDQKHQVDEQINRLCSVLSRTLGVYLNTEVTLALQATTQATYEQYITDLPSPIIIATFELSPHAPLASWQIEAVVAYTIIDCMLGGSGQQIEVPNREITSLEAAVLSRLYVEILDTWRITWGALGETPMAVKEMITTVAGLGDINAPKEQNYTAVIEATVAGTEGHMNVSMPASALQPLLQWPRESTEDRSINPALMGSMGKSVVPVKVTLGRHKRCLQEISQLQNDTIIDLKHYLDEPLTVSVAGRPKFQGQSGVRRGQLAVKIVGVIEDGERGTVTTV